jgi:hypothetical protein
MCEEKCGKAKGLFTGLIEGTEVRNKKYSISEINTVCLLRGITIVGDSSDGNKLKKRFKVDHCSHEHNIFVSNLQKPPHAVYDCSTCKRDNYKNILVVSGISLVEDSPLSSSHLTRPTRYSKYRYNTCGHTFDIIRSRVKKGVPQCAVCYPIIFEKLLKNATGTNTANLSKFRVREGDINPVHNSEANRVGITLISRSDNRCYGYYRLSCGHEAFLHYGAVRKAKSKNFKCTTCLDRKLAKEAIDAGVVYNSHLVVKSQQHSRNYTFPCGHSANLSTANVRSKQISCVECKDICFQKLLIEQNLKIIEEYPSDSKFLFELPCGHVKNIHRSAVTSYSWKCRVCQEDKYEQEAVDNGLVMNRDVEAHHHDYRNYTLQCGCTKDITIASVRCGSFECKTHSNRTIDFTKPISLYLAKLSTPMGEILKLGFSMDVPRRMKGYMVDKTAVTLAQVDYNAGQQAVDVEKLLHTKYDSYRLDKTVLQQFMENGYTECYPLEMEKVLINELEKLDTANQAIKTDKGNK